MSKERKCPECGKPLEPIEDLNTSAKQVTWIKITDKGSAPSAGEAVLGYRPSWIDKWACPDGERLCIRMNDTLWEVVRLYPQSGFPLLASNQTEEGPTHWRNFPKSPFELP